MILKFFWKSTNTWDNLQNQKLLIFLMHKETKVITKVISIKSRELTSQEPWKRKKVINLYFLNNLQVLKTTICQFWQQYPGYFLHDNQRIQATRGESVYSPPSWIHCQPSWIGLTPVFRTEFRSLWAEYIPGNLLYMRSLQV